MVRSPDKLASNRNNSSKPGSNKNNSSKLAFGKYDGNNKIDRFGIDDVKYVKKSEN